MNPFLPADVQARLVLASRSPRRRDLLAGLGFEFDVVASDYREQNGPEDSFPSIHCHQVHAALPVGSPSREGRSPLRRKYRLDFPHMSL